MQNLNQVLHSIAESAERLLLLPQGNISVQLKVVLLWWGKVKSCRPSSCCGKCPRVYSHFGCSCREKQVWRKICSASGWLCVRSAPGSQMETATAFAGQGTEAARTPHDLSGPKYHVQTLPSQLPTANTAVQGPEHQPREQWSWVELYVIR